VVHLHEVVVHCFRDADAGQIVAGGSGALGQPVGRVSRVVAADVEEGARANRLERRQCSIEVVVREFVPTRAEDARRRITQGIQEARRLGAQIDDVTCEQPLDAVMQPDDLTNSIAGADRGADDPEK
jgi:hypothetical protein